MMSHPFPIITRSGPNRLNLAAFLNNQLAERNAAANMLVFLRTFYRCLSRGIDSRSSPEAFLYTLHRAAVSLLRCRGDARCAISGFRENGRRFAGDGDLPAWYVHAAEGRSGFCSRGFRESCAACPEESRGAQLSRLGLARTRRDRFRDRTIPVRGETESRFCARPHEFLQRASPERRRCCRAPGGEGSGAAGPGRFRDASHFGACFQFFRGSRRSDRRVSACDRA